MGVTSRFVFGHGSGFFKTIFGHLGVSPQTHGEHFTVYRYDMCRFRMMPHTHMVLGHCRLWHCQTIGNHAAKFLAISDEHAGVLNRCIAMMHELGWRTLDLR